MSSGPGPQSSSDDTYTGSNNVEGFFFSLAINALTIFAAVTAFLILRKRFPKVYEPRHQLDPNSVQPIGPGLLNWFREVWALPERTVLERVGLDGYMLMHLLSLATKIFAVLAVLGCAVIIPANCYGGNGLSGFDAISMSNVETRSKMLWFHTVIVWLFSLLVYYYLYHSLQHYAEARHEYLARITASSYTVIAQNLPPSLQSDDKLREFFEQCYPGKVHSTTLFRDCLELSALFQQRDASLLKLEHAQAELAESMYIKRPRHTPPVMPGDPGVCCCGCQESVDSIRYYQREINELQEKIAALRQKQLPVLPVAAVSFNSLAATTISTQVLHQSVFKSEIAAAPAPEPGCMFWPNMRMNKHQRSVRTVLIGLAVFALVFWFMIPIAFIQSLTSIESLSKQASWLKWAVSDNAIVKGFFETYLPTLILLVFMALLPLICMVMSKAEGYITTPELEEGQMYKLFYFFLFNTFLTTTIAGSVLKAIDKLVNSPTSIVSTLGESLPKQATFFTSFVMLAISVFAMELLRAAPLVISTLKLKYMAKTDKERTDAYHPGPISYGTLYPTLIGMFMISLTYAVINPIILPFAFCYFGLGWFIWKHQIVWVYVPQFESGSLMWPSVYNRLVASVLVFQLTVLGLFGLKESYTQSPFILPLPFITGYFFYLSHGSFLRDTRHLPLDAAAEADRKKEGGLEFLEKAYVQDELTQELQPVDVTETEAEREVEGGQGQGVGDAEDRDTLLGKFKKVAKKGLKRGGGAENAEEKLEKVELDNKV